MKNILLILILIAIQSNSYSQNVINGGFEQGYLGWTYYSKLGDRIIGTAAAFYDSEITPNVNAHSGNNICRLGGWDYNENYISQTIQLPNSTPLYLCFYSQTRSATTSECGGLWVGARVRLFINNHAVSDSYLCNYNDLLNWTKWWVDLSSIAGTTVTIKYLAEAASSVWSYVYLDDIYISNTTNVEKEDNPETPFLYQNYPNPFNPNTNITYSLKQSCKVSLKIYDILGNLKDDLINIEQTPGNYTYKFDGTKLASGTYFYVLQAGDFREIKKMSIIK